MDTRKIYIGEVYANKIENKKCVKKKAGWTILYYDGINYYSLRNGKKIEVDVYNNYYLDINSLISYNSFAKTSMFTYNEKKDVIINKCLKMIGKLEELEYRKKYGYNYSKEEIDKIHSRNELTIYEKVNQILKDDNIHEIIGENEDNLNRKEYVYKLLRKTGNKSFKK